MSMACALTSHWTVAGSSHHGSKSNSSGGCFKLLAWNHSYHKHGSSESRYGIRVRNSPLFILISTANKLRTLNRFGFDESDSRFTGFYSESGNYAWSHNVIKGKHLLLREKVASTGWQISKAAQKMAINANYLPMKTKWWEKNMKGNMKNIKSQQDFDEQLLMAGDKLTVVHFFSPSCGACKALHSKVYQFVGMHPELQFLMVNYDEQKEMCRRLHVHVLPLFRFYRGAEGRICSFSCTISTIHKFKDALKRHGVQL